MPASDLRGIPFLQQGGVHYELFTPALSGGLSREMEILTPVVHIKSSCCRRDEPSPLIMLFLCLNIYHTDVMLLEDTDY